MAAEKKAKSPDGNPERTFEQSLADLEDIVADLEKGELPLEESIRKYQAGIDRLKECHKILEEAQKKVEVLTRDAKGALSLKPLDFEKTAGGEG